MYAEAAVFTGNPAVGNLATAYPTQSATYAQPPSGMLNTSGDPNAQWPWSRAGEIIPLHPASEPLPAGPRSLRTTIVMYENERYSPRSGFSSKGLILGDRGAFSNHDGSISFSSAEEMNQQMLAKGWDYEGDWMITSAYNSGADVPYSTASKEEGWMYQPDFASFANSPGHAKKGMSHFVRRRKLTRCQGFDERTLYDNLLCQSCDLNKLEQLVPLLFLSLWKALRARYGNKELKDDKIVKVKTLMTKALLALPNNAFSQALDEFVRSQGSSALPSVMSAADTAKLLEHYSVVEREGVARSLLRQFDRNFDYHCAQQNCGTSCPFAVHRCPNSGCDAKFSMKWWGVHDADCPQKEVLCPLQCGRVVVRRNTQRHTAEECIMRPVPCPYARVGCEPAGLVFRDVQAHCAVNHAYHLSLTTAVIDRVSSEVQSLRQMETGLQYRLNASQQPGVY